MKNNKRHIIYTWIVLVCFIAGQGMIFAHQHLIGLSAYSVHKTSPDQQKISEKCQLCDAMHHNSMTVETQQYFTPLTETRHSYTPVQYNFVSIALILSAGRSTPSA